ncbi:MAG: DUF3179 domain-containing protein [Pseudomonadota bacterium]
MVSTAPARRRGSRCALGFAAALAALTVGAAISAPAAAQNTPSAGLKTAWPKTDFSRSAIDFGSVIPGGPPKDGIPAIDAPTFEPAAAATALDAREPVIALTVGDTTRAYPIRYLIWHEIVNDEIAGVPVAVTYCPLCNSAIVFDRRLGGGTAATFGVSGLLRNSDMIMFDRATESWWQQFTGEAIVGALTGARLTALPSTLESWGVFRAAHPDAEVMAQPTGHARAYGRSPYSGYDASGWPMLYRGEEPPHGVPALARVVRVGSRAWPLERLRAAPGGELVEAGVRLSWRSGQASALDAPLIAEGRDVGGVRVVDAGSGAPLVHEVTYAFAFHAFEPDGAWMLGR